MRILAKDLLRILSSLPDAKAWPSQNWNASFCTVPKPKAGEAWHKQNSTVENLIFEKHLATEWALVLPVQSSNVKFNACDVEFTVDGESFSLVVKGAQ